MTKRVTDTETIDRLHRLLQHTRRAVLTCHISPDGDALGSTLALRRVLETMGIEAVVITPDLLPKTLAFLPGADTVVDGNRYADRARQLFARADLVFCLDFNARPRIDRLQAALDCATAPKVMIDHHLEPEPFADIIISHPELSSTCVLLYHLLEQAGYDKYIDSTAATLILAGMMTDTGNFAYSADDPDLYIVVSELMRKGARKEWLYKQLFNTLSESSLRINGYALAEKMEVYHDEHAALITLSRDELNRYHYVKGDTESLVNRPLAIPGVVYSCFMREEENYIKVSMRSIGDLPVDRLCTDHFNGGGHRNAAGGEYRGSLDECAALFRSLMSENRKKYIEKDSL